MNARHRKILTDFVSLPTAPFVERAGLDYLRRFVADRAGLSMRADRFGNLLVRYRGGRAKAARPLVFAGHLDHPGFIAVRMKDDRHVVAEWRGWVERKYFRGARVRFFADGREIPGQVVEVAGDGLADKKATRKRRTRQSASARSFGAEAPPNEVTIRVSRPVPAGAPGMWDFPGARTVGSTFYARACDDVAGVSAILCMLDELCRTKAAADCYAFFTRAEEVGFGGALAAVEGGTLPAGAVVVAVECSKAITGVALGAGPVLRVGDRASVFTPAATAFCQVVAEELAGKEKSFVFQRKLMDGGTCESTVYCHYGHDATGICLPLGNYHNMDTQRGRIGPEFIDLRDFDCLVRWFIALATTKRRYTGVHPGLDQRLDALLKKHKPKLLQTVAALTAGA